MVTETKGEKGVGTVNLEVKSGLLAGSKVSLTVDEKQSFDLIPVGNKAWSEKDDAKMIDAFKKGSSAKVIYTTPDGYEVTEVYSLSGFTKAKQAIDKACK